MNNYTGEETASANFTANMMDRHEGKLSITMNDEEQTIFFIPRPRHFGGQDDERSC